MQGRNEPTLIMESPVKFKSSPNVFWSYTIIIVLETFKYKLNYSRYLFSHSKSHFIPGSEFCLSNGFKLYDLKFTV